MKEPIDKIRAALDELEQSASQPQADRMLREFSAFELPAIVRDIVDFLMPLLTPYQAAFYWKIFRASVLENGTQYARVSTRSLITGVILSPYSVRGGDNPDRSVSYRSIQRALTQLEGIGAIRKEGDPVHREGTLYKVLIPEEIEACRKTMEARQANVLKPVDVEKDVDFYNVRENRHKVFERDSYKCRYCGKQLTRFTATLDHVKAISAGGDNSYENLMTACLDCNSKKTGRLLADFLAERP